jgi:orotidine-5'-phosphate decarboxylase
MTKKELVENIKSKNSFLCVGLDSDITKIPKHLLVHEDPVFEFNKAIIDATKNYCVCYKINTAFYESNGVEGWISMQKTIAYIPKDIFIIADAKRGDIGNTSAQYAKAFFEKMNCDAITVAPYMGKDSVSPFLEFANKWTIVLALTSNEGASDFQLMRDDSTYLYEHVIKTVSQWGSPENLMFVIGATKALELQNVRKMVPDNFLLIPGVGAQGGSLQDVFRFGANNDIGLLVNASRAIIFADSTENFASKAGEIAKEYQKEMKVLLDEKFG